MLRGNPPPPPNIPFFLFLSISFPSLFKKNLKISGGGGLNPLNPPPLNTPLHKLTYYGTCLNTYHAYSLSATI